MPILPMSSRSTRAYPSALVGLLLVGLTWVYWPTLVEMTGRWSHDPQYSHGYLVPAFSLALLWFRRATLNIAALHGSWWGAPLFVFGTFLRIAGARFYFEWLETV